MFPPKPPKGADPRMYFFLFLLTLGTTLGYQGWTLLYTNFAVESAHLSAADNGLVQSLREVPGLLGFLIIPLLLVMKEHRVAAVAALATGLGTALTGFFTFLRPSTNPCSSSISMSAPRPWLWASSAALRRAAASRRRSSCFSAPIFCRIR